MKVLVISQPKSGTYLCANILQNLGLEFTFQHLSQHSFGQYYKQDFNIGRANPQSVTKPRSFAKSLSVIGDNQFSVSHIKYSKDNEKLLQPFKKVVLSRDEREAAISWNLYKKETGRNMRELQKIVKTSLEWANTTNSFLMGFEDMVGKNTLVIDNLQIFLFGKVKYDSEMIITLSLTQDSITKSSRRK